MKIDVVKKNYVYILILVSIIIYWIYIILSYNKDINKVESEVIVTNKILESEISQLKNFKQKNFRFDNIIYSDDILPKLNNPFKGIFDSQYLDNILEQNDEKKIYDAINLSNLELSGIVNINNQKYAIINDKIVKEGDMISEVTVYKILDKQVILKDNNKSYYINMKKDGE